MKKSFLTFAIILLSVSISFAQPAKLVKPGVQQEITVLTASTYSVPSTQTIDTAKAAARIAELTARDKAWAQRIDDDTAEIATLQEQIDAGAKAGVTEAAQFASSDVQSEVGYSSVAINQVGE